MSPPPTPVIFIAGSGTLALVAFVVALILARGHRKLAALPLLCFGLAFALPWFGISLHGAAAWGTVVAGIAVAAKLGSNTRIVLSIGAIAMSVAAMIATVTF